jgi:hypothetical protein
LKLEGRRPLEKDKVKGGLLPDLVVRESAAILKLLTNEDETLLVRRDILLVLGLALYVVDGIGRLQLDILLWLLLAAVTNIIKAEKPSLTSRFGL